MTPNLSRPSLVISLCSASISPEFQTSKFPKTLENFRNLKLPNSKSIVTKDRSNSRSNKSSHLNIVPAATDIALKSQNYEKTINLTEKRSFLGSKFIKSRIKSGDTKTFEVG